MDTNDNQRYDYVRSDGFQDVGYTADGQVLTAQAQVTVPPSAAPTSTTASGTTTTDATASVTPTATATATSTSSQPETSAATTASESGDGSDPLGTASSILGPLIVIGAIGAVAFVWVRNRGR